MRVNRSRISLIRRQYLDYEEQKNHHIIITTIGTIGTSKC